MTLLLGIKERALGDCVIVRDRLAAILGPSDAVSAQPRGNREIDCGGARHTLAHATWEPNISRSPPLVTPRGCVVS